MFFIRVTPVFIAIISITACTGQVALLKNDKGELARCEVSTGEAMASGLIIRNMTISRCIKTYEAAGYTKMNP